eukprot:12885362-Prorocentrum_lima.AAC.1
MAPLMFFASRITSSVSTRLGRGLVVANVFFLGPKALVAKRKYIDEPEMEETTFERVKRERIFL